MKCPNCGAELQINYADMEELDGHVYIYYAGVCHKCNHYIRWYDQYDYVDSCISEISKNDH